MATTRPMNFSIPDDIYKHLEGQPNRSAYVAELVRQDKAHRYQALVEAADDLCSDLTQLLCEIDEMGHAGHHVEQIRKSLNDNKNLARVVDLMSKVRAKEQA